MGKGLLAPACNDTRNSLLALCLVFKLTNAKLNPRWDTVQRNYVL